MFYSVCRKPQIQAVEIEGAQSRSSNPMPGPKSQVPTRGEGVQPKETHIRNCKLKAKLADQKITGGGRPREQVHEEFATNADAVDFQGFA